MIQKPIFRTLLFIGLSILLWGIYFLLYIQTDVIVRNLLDAKGNESLLTQWIYEFYPRLQTEKWRFDEIFFLRKAHQVLLRNTLTLQLILLCLSYWYIIKNKIQNLWHKNIDVSIDSSHLTYYITPVLYSCLAFVVYDFVMEFQGLIAFKGFYKPIGIGKLLLPSFPSLVLLWGIYLVLWISIITVMTLPYKWISASFAVIGFVYYQLIFSGFEKYDHGYTTMTYALMVYPFVLYEQEKSTSNRTAAWGIWLIQCLICLSYFYSGAEKILISGWDWVASNNLQQHLLMHEINTGIKISQFDFLCKLLSLGTLLFQCSFIGILFFKRMRYIILPIGFIFHTSTYFLLGAGGIINPWWVMYLFFLFPLQPLETKSNRSEL